jgi:hypothetical protein
MFYLNSEDHNIVPDALFFLHKIGLLKHKMNDSVPTESVYYLNNNVPEIVLTEDSFAVAPSAAAQTVLIFDFVSSDDLQKYHGHNLIIIPHVYFDYISTIKLVSESTKINSYKIFSPLTKNTTLIPKSHLKATLPFLNSTHFANHIFQIEQFPQRTEKIDYTWRLQTLLGQVFKFTSILLLFFLRPLTTLKLFFSKYNITFIYGNLRVVFIKIFYAISNFRYFAISQMGWLRVQFIRAGFWIFNLRFSLKNLLFHIGQLRYFAISQMGWLRVQFIRAAFFFLNLRFRLKNLLFHIGQLRYFAISQMGWLRIQFIRAAFFFLNLRFMFYRYSPKYILGNLRVGFIKAFYFFINLRFPLFHYLNRFYWFNFNYTLYPARKTYWFISYQLEKRIFSKFSHASKN